MTIARRPHSAGAKTRYEIHYSDWLASGDTLTSVGTTVVIDPASGVSDVTISGLQVNADHLYFFVQGGAVAETFNVIVTTTTNRGEVAIDTVEFFVVKP